MSADLGQLWVVSADLGGLWAVSADLDGLWVVSADLGGLWAVSADLGGLWAVSADLGGQIEIMPKFFFPYNCRLLMDLQYCRMKIAMRVRVRCQKKIYTHHLMYQKDFNNSTILLIKKKSMTFLFS